MRPVDKGDWPEDAEGCRKEFSDYSEARGDLIGRLGEYCSYCEMHLDSSLAVEHVQPKTHHPDLRTDWDNFLLACGNCNPTKGSEDVRLDDYFWPDRNNTFLAFEYIEGGRVRVSRELAAELRSRAQATVTLTGLDKTPLNDPKAADRRWQNRRETWDMATHVLERLHAKDSLEFRETIVNLAKAKGYWSVWMTVFADDKDMVRRFIERFQGTYRDCFNAEYKPIPRTAGGI